jgi:hypothetical protein
MAKSSYAVAILLAGWSADVAAEPPPGGVTADAAMKRYEQWFNGSSPTHCPQPGQVSDEEIVVCGRTYRQPGRSPLPVSREPGEIVRHAGEAGGGGAGPDACTRVCQQPVQVNVFQVISAIPKVVRHILHGDD